MQQIFANYCVKICCIAYKWKLIIFTYKQW